MNGGAGVLDLKHSQAHMEQDIPAVLSNGRPQLAPRLFSTFQVPTGRASLLFPPPAAPGGVLFINATLNDQHQIFPLLATHYVVVYCH
jgi:hypothetical protein